jgi:hypothetical protein
MRPSGLTLRLAVVTIALVVFAGTNLMAQCAWNATASVLSTTCRVGVNTTAPGFPLEAVGDGGSVQMVVTSYAGGFFLANFMGRGARGTAAAPTHSLANDYLMSMGGRGYVDGTGFPTHHSARIAFRAAADFSGTSQGGYITFDTVDAADPGFNLVTRFTIDSSGHVGIGAAPGASLLNVGGDLVATGAITGARVINAVYQDVAEWVEASEPIDAGTVVVLDRDRNNEVTPSASSYDTTVAGVVSANPGIVLGRQSASKVMVATTGRVKVKVDATKHPVKIGDLLVTSDKPGVAMVSEPVNVAGIKLHRPGTIIGKALEPLASGQGEVLVLLSMQ